MRSLPAFIAATAIVLLAFAASLPAFADYTGFITNTGIKGKVSISRNAKGEIASVTITGKDQSYTITPVKIVTPKGFLDVKTGDLAKLAKYENQVVKVSVTIIEGNRVVEVRGVVPAEGSGKDKL